MKRNEDWDERACDETLRSIADGSLEFGDKIEVLWPACVSMARQGRTLRGIGATDDDVLEVGVRALERLGRESARAITLLPDWLARNPEKSATDWLRVVVTNVARDYVRARSGGRPLDPEEGLSLKARLNVCVLSLQDDDGAARPPVTAVQTAREIVEFASGHLPADQSSALAMWLAGAGFDDIRDDLSMESSADAKKLLRAAIASLRRRFNTV